MAIYLFALDCCLNKYKQCIFLYLFKHYTLMNFISFLYFNTYKYQYPNLAVVLRRTIGKFDLLQMFLEKPLNKYNLYMQFYLRLALSRSCRK